MFVNLISSVLVASAAAFDCDEWMAKREILSHEAERLQLAYSNCLARIESPSENVKIPIETFADGSIKTFLTAEKVKIFLDSEFIWGEGVDVRHQQDRASGVAHINAENCVVDRLTKSGWAAGAARLTHESTTCDGEGVYFSSPEGFVSISRNARIVSKNLKLATPSGKADRLTTRDVGRLGGADASLVITSEACAFDREERLVFFDRRVRVSYAEQYTLSADRVFVFLSEENELSRIVALGHVVIKNESRSGSCARAIFRRAVGEIEMFAGGKDEPAHLQEADGNAVDGSRIKFWLDAEQVEVIDSVLTVKKAGKGDWKQL